MTITRNQWMTGKYGLMVHYLPPDLLDTTGRRHSDLNSIVNRFDLRRFLAGFDASGAEYLIFTLGQNTGFYNSPNPIIDHYAGAGHCPERDLAVELAQALKSRGKRFIAYLPCEVRANPSLHQGFRWNTEPDTPQLEFQRRWLEVIAFWAGSFGRLLDGWWFDGCYDWSAFDRKYLLWDQWYAAARSGNPKAVVTFNDGCYCAGNTGVPDPGCDYLSGETFMLWEGLPRLAGKHTGYRPTGPYAPGGTALNHLLFSLDAMWWHGAPADIDYIDQLNYVDPASLAPGEMEPPLYADDEILTAIDAYCGQGGAVTMNAGIFLDGSLGPETVAQLRRIRCTEIDRMECLQHSLVQS